jgi:hypothetical protein
MSVTLENKEITLQKKCCSSVLRDFLFIMAFISITASEEFILKIGEIQSAGRIMEGTVPVPPYRPCAENDYDVLPVLELSYSGAPKPQGRIGP